MKVLKREWVLDDSRGSDFQIMLYDIEVLTLKGEISAVFDCQESNPDYSVFKYISKNYELWD